MASCVGWTPRTAGCKIASFDENGDSDCSGSNSELHLAGEDGVGRSRLVLKGEGARDSDSLKSPGIGVSLRLKSFPNFLAPVEVF